MASFQLSLGHVLEIGPARMQGSAIGAFLTLVEAEQIKTRHMDSYLSLLSLYELRSKLLTDSLLALEYRSHITPLVEEVLIMAHTGNAAYLRTPASHAPSRSLNGCGPARSMRVGPGFQRTVPEVQSTVGWL